MMGVYCGGDLGTGIIQEQRLFTLALGLVPPWALDDVRLTVEGKWPAPHVNFPKGSFFPCPVCGQDCPLHDTQEKVWRHLDFSQHAAYLHAQGPRVQYSEHGVHLVPVGIVAGVVRETDNRLWRVLEHYVEKARATVGNRRGHDYITLFVDLVAKRLLCSRTGEVAKTFKAFAEVLQLYGGSAEAIMDISMDLSPAFQKGAAEHLPRAQVTFDRFYRLELINEAVGAVRKGEAHNRPSLEKTRSLWLKNPGKLIAKQSKRLQDLLEEQNLRTAQAYQFRLTFQEIFTIQNRHHGAYTLMNHWDWVLRWFESQITKGILERFDSLLQSAKAKARGYRTHKNFIAIACLILGKLDLRLTT